jgi:hypothetical protein
MTGVAAQAWPATGAAERMRRCRRRKAKGLRVIPVQIFDREITNLVTRGFLAASERDDRRAVAHAMGKMLNALTSDRWPMAPRRWTL